MRYDKKQTGRYDFIVMPPTGPMKGHMAITSLTARWRIPNKTLPIYRTSDGAWHVTGYAEARAILLADVVKEPRLGRNECIQGYELREFMIEINE